MDRASIVIYKLTDTLPENDDCILLDVMARATEDNMSSSTSMSDDGNIVRAGDNALQLFYKEIDNTTQDVHTKNMRTTSCPPCPFRSFDRIQRLQAHLQKHLSAGKQGVICGLKQLKIAIALFDNDIIRNRQPTALYLRRSAEVLRSHMQRPLSDNDTNIGRQIRLVLTATQPYYEAAVVLCETGKHRRAGNIYYDKSFADFVFKESMMSQAMHRM